MEKPIEELIASTEFCNGRATPQIYATAWVARIYNKEKTGPEFPESVHYIRRKQFSDGSWGVKEYFIFDRIVSTLCAIICLKQWNSEDDQDSIEKAVKFIKNNLIHLGDLKMLKSQMSVAFELLLPALIDEAKDQFQLDLGHDAIIQIYRTEKEAKLDKIDYCEQLYRDKCTKVPGFGSWYFNVEGLRSKYNDEQIERMIGRNGLICDCYSATAYSLWKGIQSNESLNSIKQVVDDNQGGVPNITKLVVFDLAWSINTLYFSGYPILNGKLVNHIERLASIWKNNQGLVGGTPDGGLPPDADDISNTILALKLTDSFPDIETTQTLKSFFRGQHFVTYEAEMQPSLTTNIHCLIALSKLKQLNDGLEIFEDTLAKCTEWTKAYIVENNYSFDDKWNLSKYYGMSRALIAFVYLDLEFSKTILKRMIEQQNNDGGWGFQGSTALESAHSIIAMSYWLRSSNDNTREDVKHCLKRAAVYMSKTIDDYIPRLWICKGLYSLKNMDKLTIMCARYTLCNFYHYSESKTKFADFEKDSNKMEGLINRFVAHKIRGLNVKKINRSQYFEFTNGYIKAFLKQNQLEEYNKLLGTIDYTFHLLPSKEAHLFLSIYALVIFVVDDHLEQNPQDVEKWLNYFKYQKCPEGSGVGLIAQFYFTESKRLINQDFYKQFNELSIEWLNNFDEKPKFKVDVQNSFTDQEFIDWRIDDFNGRNFIFFNSFECLRVTDELKHNSDFIALNNEVGKYWILINDLFSFIKEAQKGLVEVNYLYIKIEKNGMALEEAMDQMVTEINQCERMAHLYADKLIATNIDGMPKYVQGLFGVMHGSAYWSAICGRYKNPELKFYTFD